MSDDPNQQGCAMSQNIDKEIAAMREEINDLEKAIARQDPPLAQHTRAIAEAKIATLQSQIAAMKGDSGRQPTPSE
jgi:4-diphosphocytidyl-2C-methyl-D-erythritol kinase